MVSHGGTCHELLPTVGGPKERNHALYAGSASFAATEENHGRAFIELRYTCVARGAGG